MNRSHNSAKGEALKNFFLFLQSRDEKSILLTILIVAVFLRIPLLLWGLPLTETTGYYQPDEVPILESLLTFPSNILTNQLVYYGGTINLIWGTLSLPVKYFFSVIPKIHSVIALPNVLHIVCRLFSVITAIYTIYLTYYLARLYAHRNTALLSALLISVSFYHCISSAYITFDVSLTCFVLINFILLWHTLKSNSWRAYIISGICTGLLCSIKISGGIFFFVFFAAVISRHFINQHIEQSQRWYSDNTLTKFLTYCIAALFFFCLSSPHVILQLDLFIDTIMRDRILWTFREEGGYIQLLARIAKSMINVTNSGLLLSASIGIIQLVRSKKRFSYLFLLYIIGNILIWGAYVRERFFLPLVPFLCIYAAEGLIVLLHNKKRRIKAAITLAIVALVSISLFQCLQGISLRLHDTRTEASKFIHAHIPSEASLGIAYISKKTPAPPHKTYYPPINETRFTTVDIANYPEYIVISSYDLTPIIEAFVNNTVTNKYTIKDEYLKNWPYYQAPSSNLLRFYANLLEGRTDYILLKRFSRRIDVPIEHHPPTIWVIKRDKERAQQFPKERFSYRSCFH